MAIQVKVSRFNPCKDKCATYQTFRVPRVFNGKQTVLDVLEYIYENIDRSLAFYRSCRLGPCGGCLIMINGKAGLACLTKASKEMALEPIRGYEVIRDLVVKREKEDHSAVDFCGKPDTGQISKISKRCAERARSGES